MRAETLRKILMVAAGVGLVAAAAGQDFAPPRPTGLTAPPVDRTEAPVKRVSTKKREMPDMPRDLLKYMEESLQVVADERDDAAVKRAFRDAFTDILEASRRCQNHPRATDGEKAEAIQYEVSAHYQWARMEPSTNHAAALATRADELYKADPKADTSALAAFLAIKAKHETDLGIEPAALPQIKNYLKNFPRDEAAIELMVDVAMTAETAGDQGRAKEALSLVKTTFPKHEMAERVPAILRRLDLVGNPLPMTGRSTDARPISTIELKNKIVIIDVWATWCQPCVADMDRLKELWDKYHDQGVEIIGVPLDEDMPKLRKFLADKKLPWLNLDLPANEKERGWEHPFAKEYGIGAMPMKIIIDKSGKVVATNVRGAMLEQKIADLLGKPLEGGKITSKPTFELFK